MSTLGRMTLEGSPGIIWAHPRHLPSSELIWDHLSSSGLIWHDFKSSGIFWAHLASSGLSWAQLASSGIIWDRLGSSTHLRSYNFIWHTQKTLRKEPVFQESRFWNYFWNNRFKTHFKGHFKSEMCVLPRVFEMTFEMVISKVISKLNWLIFILILNTICLKTLLRFRNCLVTQEWAHMCPNAHK